MGLFQPRWMNKDIGKALDCIEKLRDEEKLRAAAIESPHEDVRVAATKKLSTDDAKLCVIAHSDGLGAEKEALLKALVESVQDREKLKACMNDKELIVRYLALKRLGRDRQAFDALKAAFDRGAPLDISLYLEDLSVEQCRSILMTTAHWKIRCERELFDHMKKLTPDGEAYENMLCDIALNAKSDLLRWCSSKRLSLPDVLKRYNLGIAEENRRKRAEEEAEKQREKQRLLIYQKSLGRIALSTNDLDVRKKTIDEINDPDVLTQVIKSTARREYWMRYGVSSEIPYETYYAALEKLKDQHSLGEVAMADINYNIAWKAIDMMTDQGELKKVALYGHDESARRRAAKRVDDPSIPEKINSYRCSHKWIEIPGSKVYTIDRDDFSCGTYKVRCAACGAVEIREFSHYYDV